MRRLRMVLVAAVSCLGCRDAVRPDVVPLAKNVNGNPQHDYEMVLLPSLPAPAGSHGEAVAINDRGHVVGWSGPGFPSPGHVTHAFLWSDSGMTDLGTLGGDDSWAQLINDADQVVGYSFTAGGQRHAFLWQDGVMTDLGTLGGTTSLASALASGGAVVGSSPTASGATHAFLWQGGVLQDLGTLGGSYSAATAINDRGQVVGESTDSAGQTHGFLWEQGVMLDLGTLGGSYCSANAINPRGTVTGVSSDSAGARHAFVWADGVIRNLGEPPGTETSFGTLVTNRGDVIGGTYHASFLWSGTAIQDLGSLYPSHPVTVVYATNEREQVVGQSSVTMSITYHGFIWENGLMRDLGVPPGWVTAGAYGLNARGDVVGWTSRSIAPSREVVHPILWRRGPPRPQ